MPNHLNFDVLIIGSGIAGLSIALQLADKAKIGLITKVELFNSSSQYAQGGIAAVTDSKDFADHIEDTLIAGAGLCDEATVAFTVEQAPTAINWLIEQGVAFSRDPNQPKAFHLTKEGGHRTRRIYHVADSTGAAVIKTLATKASQHPNITCLTDHTAIDLLVADQQCFGAKVIDKAANQIQFLFAKHTVLATGGASTVYLHTSNPQTSTGDGLAMAWRAGCRVANMEFNQFHPTSLHHPNANSFLISEAVRGEGGILCLPNGTRFMPQYDKRAELAPRDIVARSITLEMHKYNLSHVLLDISHKPTEKIFHLFPMIASRCREFGFDISKTAIPVVPAAHYTCGGIMTDHQARTDIQCLYAIGEVAYTGLHGANRMASNSLLECLVFATSAAHDIQKHLKKITAWSLPQFAIPSTLQQSRFCWTEELKFLTTQLGEMMSSDLSVIRTNKAIVEAEKKALNLISTFQDITSKQKEFTVQQTLNHNAFQNRIQVAQLMIHSAFLRQESRGCHYNSDFPEIATHTTKAIPTILTPKANSVCEN